MYHLYLPCSSLETQDQILAFATNIKEVYDWRGHWKREMDDGTKAFRGECIAGNHYHILCSVKYGTKEMRSVGKPWCERTGVHPIWLELWKNHQLMGHKFVHGALHFENTKKYMEPYSLDLGDDILTLVNHKKALSRYEDNLRKGLDKILDPLNNEIQTKYTVEQIRAFRARYPKACDWRRMSALRNWSKYQTGVCKELEAAAVELEKKDMKNMVPTKTEEFIGDIAYEYILKLRAKAKDNGIGSALILAGAAATGKSTLARIIGSQFPPVVKWIGKQWAEKDILKWDTPLQKQARCIIVEECIWSIPSKKIDAKMSLNIIKENMQGEMAVRAAKNKEHLFDTVSMDTFIFTYNPSRETPYQLLHDLIHEDDALLRRVLIENVPNLFQEAHKKYPCSVNDRQVMEEVIIAYVEKKLQRGITYDEFWAKRTQLIKDNPPDVEQRYRALADACVEETGDSMERFWEDGVEMRMKDAGIDDLTPEEAEDIREVEEWNMVHSEDFRDEKKKDFLNPYGAW